MKQTGVTLFLLVVTLTALTGCGGSDLSTPRATIETAQEALSNRNWDRLYATTSDDWRKEYIPKWRSHLRNLLRRTDAAVDVEVSTVDQLSDKQVFRTFLEVLSQSRRTKRLVNAYASADVTVENRENDRAVLRAKSPLPLPEERATLKRQNGKWKFHRLDRQVSAGPIQLKRNFPDSGLWGNFKRQSFRRKKGS